jgi:protocatechuate 3,4-dioxygenase beta subunit
MKLNTNLYRLMIVLMLTSLAAACTVGAGAPTSTSDQSLDPAETSASGAAPTPMILTSEDDRRPDTAATAESLSPTATMPAVTERPQPTRAPLTPTDQPTPDNRPTETIVLTPVPTTEPTPVNLIVTAAQGEGPYYPITEPVERDNDLTSIPGSEGAPVGEILLLSGRVLYQNAIPLSGAVVEIWQTDANGIYMHPDDPLTGDRDPNFQFYGESVTGQDGSYAFRTVVPGLYGSRPRHIHLKVKIDGQELLISQFYFAGDERIAEGQLPETIVLTSDAGVDAAGAPVLVAEKDIVLAGTP